jgi:hypothetical protein
VQAYLPMDEQQQREFERLVTGEASAGVRAVNTTWYEKGIEKGEEIGRRRLLRELLERRFPQLPTSAAERLQQLPADEIVGLIERLPQANSLRDLGLEE